MTRAREGVNGLLLAEPPRSFRAVAARVYPQARPPTLRRPKPQGHTLPQAREGWDKAQDRPRNGRCRMHGGLSTGPLGRPEGKRKVGRRRLLESGVRGKGKVDRIHLLRPELLAPLSLELKDLAALDFKLAEIDLNRTHRASCPRPGTGGQGDPPLSRLLVRLALDLRVRPAPTLCSHENLISPPVKTPDWEHSVPLMDHHPSLWEQFREQFYAVFCGTCKPTVEQKIRFHVWLPSICGRSRTRPEAMLLSDAKTGKNLC